MIKRISLIIFMFGCIQFGHAQTKSKQISAQPKLVVGIIVDQMKPEYLERYKNKFSANGFMRLINSGFQCNNVHYNYVPTYTGPGHASVYTGCTPAMHGIISNDWFDRKTRDTIYCAEDTSVQTVGAANANGKMSPRNLITSTITDELRLHYLMQSKVIAVSMKDRGSILPGGHTANAAYWFDGLTGNWITSTHYMNQLPKWVNDFNAKKIPDAMLSKPWNTLLPIEKYTESDKDNSPYEGKYFGEAEPVFPHDFPKLKQANYELIRRSPLGNTLTKDFALKAIDAEQLGKDSITDFIAISFSCTDYVGHQFGTNAIETEDTYLRLDLDIADMLMQLDKKVGAGNYLLFLTADHAAVPNPQYLTDNKIPSGFFNAKTMIDSLKKVLIKNYGDSNLFLCYDNTQIYMNHELCNSKNINIKQLSNLIADFVVGFEGVKDALSGARLTEFEYTTGIKHLVQMGYNRKRSGDVVLMLEPGLIEWLGKTGTSHGSPYTYDTHVPLLWYGHNIRPGSTNAYYDITSITPTLALMLKIEFPNGSCTKGIDEVMK